MFCGPTFSSAAHRVGSQVEPQVHTGLQPHSTIQICSPGPLGAPGCFLEPLGKNIVGSEQSWAAVELGFCFPVRSQGKSPGDMEHAPLVRHLQAIIRAVTFHGETSYRYRFLFLTRTKTRYNYVVTLLERLVFIFNN